MTAKAQSVVSEPLKTYSNRSLEHLTIQGIERGDDGAALLRFPSNNATRCSAEVAAQLSVGDQVQRESIETRFGQTTGWRLNNRWLERKSDGELLNEQLSELVERAQRYAERRGGISYDQAVEALAASERGSTVRLWPLEFGRFVALYLDAVDSIGTHVLEDDQPPEVEEITELERPMRYSRFELLMVWNKARKDLGYRAHLLPERDAVLVSDVEAELQISAERFVANAHGEAWEYTGALDDIVEWFKEEFPGTQCYWDSDLELDRRKKGLAPQAPLVSHGGNPRGSYNIRLELTDLKPADWISSKPLPAGIVAHDEETAWRQLLGYCLVLNTQPSASLAKPGESLGELKELLRKFESDRGDDDALFVGEAEKELKRRFDQVESGYSISLAEWTRKVQAHG